MNRPNVQKTDLYVDNQQIMLYTLNSENGMSLVTTNLGASALRLVVDRRDVLLGFAQLSAQLQKGPMFGATLGRYAGKINGSKYYQDGHEILLSRSHGENHAHGGVRGFDKRVFDVIYSDANSVSFRYISSDGEEGYPGTMVLDVTYSILNGDTVRIEYDVVCDADTVACISNHMYFNLLGNGAGDIGNHVLTLSSDKFQAIVDGAPSGDLKTVAGTPLDFTSGAKLSERADQLSDGIDFDFAINKQNDLPAAILEESLSRLKLSVFTDMPCLHVYLADFGDMNYPGKDGAVYSGRCGCCFEPMYFSNCVNTGLGEMPYLRAGEKRHNETTLKFSKRI